MINTTIKLTPAQHECLDKLSDFNNLKIEDTIIKLLNISICYIKEGDFNTHNLNDIIFDAQATKVLEIPLKHSHTEALKSTEYFQVTNNPNILSRIIVYITDYISSQYDEYSEIGWSDEQIFTEMEKINQIDNCQWIK